MTPSLQRLTSTLHEHIWGGRKLASKYGKGDEIHTRIAETWENCEALEKSSVILKWIDTDLPTSAHTHPCESENEIWIVVETEPESRVGIGFNKTVSHDDIHNALENRTLGLLINQIEAKPGDCFVIPPGTIHYIDGGVTLLEITPRKNTALRLYDWCRETETDRMVHVFESLTVMYFEGMIPPHVFLPDRDKAFHVPCGEKSIAVRWHEITNKTVINDASEVRLLTCLCGEGKLGHQEQILPGETMLISNREIEVNPISEKCVILETNIFQGIT